jgi:uncharacterized protein (TIGR00661 family)
MKTILYYISDHGLGHLTRSVAIIRDIQNKTKILIRNSNIDFLEKSLPGIPILEGKTDQGAIISDNSISINWKETESAVTKWYSNFKSNTESERIIINKIKPDLIVSDISPIPLFAAKKLEIPSIAISNFTWLDIFSRLENFDLKDLELSYENTSLCIQLPFSTSMDVFKNKKKVGIISKNITKTNDKVRDELNIDKSKFVVFINLPKFFKITFRNFENFQIISTGAKTNLDNTIFINPITEGQNLINASDLVICKCGYGMITECLSSGTPFQLIADNNHPEQKAMIDKLETYGIKNVIPNWENGEIVIDFNSIKYYKNFKNENSIVKNIIMEFL